MKLNRTGKIVLAIGIIVGLPVSILLFAGQLVMNQICELNANNIKDQSWLDFSTKFCQTFTYLNKLIEKFVNNS